MTTIDRNTDGDVGIEHAAEFARRHPGLVKFGRVGWVAKGTVYSLTGLLALLIALGSDSARPAAPSQGPPDQEASQSGAIARIAQSAGGVIVLYVIAIGLVLYSGWRIVSALLPASSSASSWVTRIGYLVSAATYLVLAAGAVSIARHPGERHSTEDTMVESFTRDVLAHSYGRVAVFAVGVVLIGIAGAFLWKAISASFTSELAHRPVGPVSFTTIVAMGRIGWVGRAAMMGLIGFFLCRAAVMFDAAQAQGLDGSLRKAVTTGLGTALAIVVAMGLLVYGVFCILSAPRQLLVAADR
jgi:hypothetical protein